MYVVYIKILDKESIRPKEDGWEGVTIAALEHVTMILAIVNVMKSRTT